MKFSIVFSVILLSCALAIPVFSSGYSYTDALSTLADSGVSAESCVLYCLDTDETVYSKEENKKLPMASTTKIMTAVVVLENARLSDIIQIPSVAVGVEGSSAYLYQGEKISVRDLLYALMLESANDAAVALAVHTGGDVDSFVSMMNEKADEIGMADSNFENPHGLDSEEHYSTAYDMALLCDYAMQNDEFAEITGTYRKETDTRLFINHNRLLKSCDGVVGGKTGFTKRSGRCLVSVARRNGVTMCAVTLNAPNDWSDHKNMYDAAFDAYESVSIDGTEYDVPVINGRQNSVTVAAGQTDVVIKKESAERLTVRVECDRFIYAPVSKGESVGWIVYSDGDKEICRTELTAKNSVLKNKNKTFIEKIISYIF